MLDIQRPSAYHAFSSNTYLISSNGEYAVIDPSVPYEAISLDIPVKYILLTHSHFDHMLDIESWVAATGAPVMISMHEVDKIFDPDFNCYRMFMGCDKGYKGEVTSLSDGDALHLGDEVITVRETPGHSPGSVCYFCGDVAFVGDTVFAGGGYGRFDLPGGDPSALRRSIEFICSLPDNITLYCGHGELTTVKQYKKDFMI